MKNCGIYKYLISIEPKREKNLSNEIIFTEASETEMKTI